MESSPVLDTAGRRRSPATLSSFHEGQPARNKGLRCPPDPPTVQEIIAVMRAAGGRAEGIRLRGVIVVLWRAGLRISEGVPLLVIQRQLGHYAGDRVKRGERPTRPRR